ncbi:MAG TPA: flavohemoglobin expression-modulating QEGLA motif protein [Pirellulales bacterium]|nr:flavohemoglobin expression-modulating QEGLA motif protein [Pirellulales bacterium]
MSVTHAWTTYKEKVRHLSGQIVDAQRPIRVREAIKWDDSVEQAFLAAKCRQLPKVGHEYYAEGRPLPFVVADKLAEFRRIEQQITDMLGADDAIGKILLRNCGQYSAVLRMLEARGTPEFYHISRELYGSPKDTFPGDTTTLRELGLLLYEILTGIPEDGLGAVHHKTLSAEEVVDRLNAKFGGYFHDNQVHVKLDDGILSDAAAGADYVKIKRGAMFSEREVDLLEVHEGWVHVGSSLNGARQHVASWLAKGPPCTLAIQEGLAAIVEVITFNATPARTKMLVNRILACDKVEDGADFLDIFEFYRAEGYDEHSAYTYAQRVFRGGVVSGGACFTKDICYTKGFVLIYNFLRTAIRFGRPDLIPLLFVGKVTLEELPILCRKAREGVVDPPLYLPPQFRDLNGLAMWMAYSNFFNRVNLSSIQEYYRSWLCA